MIGVHVLSIKITAVNPARHAAKDEKNNFLCLMVPSLLLIRLFTATPDTTFIKIYYAKSFELIDMFPLRSQAFIVFLLRHLLLVTNWLPISC
jgi:hypothetical protein